MVISKIIVPQLHKTWNIKHKTKERLQITFGLLFHVICFMICPTSFAELFWPLPDHPGSLYF